MLEEIKRLKNDPAAAIIVVDMQPDFYPGGALAVPGGDEIVEPIREAMEGFQTIVFTQDSHPKTHISFASSYLGKKPFEILSLSEVNAGKIESKLPLDKVKAYLKNCPNEFQVLWPDHCVQDTAGWSLDSRLPLSSAHLILRKGTNSFADSYSGFFENDKTSTGLSGYLKSRGVKKVFVCGLAGDYCVLWTAQDAQREGFEVFYSADYTRYVNFPVGSKEAALDWVDKMKKVSK